MAEEHKGLVKLLKSHPDESERFYAERLNIDGGKIGPLMWFNEPIADPNLQFKATKANIVKARQQGIRWERIAARTGISVGAAREMGGKEAMDVYTGRGRPTGGYTPNGGNGKSSGRGGQKSGTSGRRAAASKGKSQPRGRGRARARTRAEARAKAGDPS